MLFIVISFWKIVKIFAVLPRRKNFYRLISHRFPDGVSGALTATQLNIRSNEEAREVLTQLINDESVDAYVRETATSTARRK